MKRFFRSKLLLSLGAVFLLAIILASTFLGQGLFAHANGPSNGTGTTTNKARATVSSSLNPFTVQTLNGGTKVVVYDGDQLLNNSTETTVMNGFTVPTGDAAKTTWVVGDGQCGTAPVPLLCSGGHPTAGSGDTAGFTGGNGSLTIGPDAFRGSDSCPWGPDTCLWDTRTADVTNFVSPGDTSVSATVASGIVDGENPDCINHVAQVFSTGPKTVASSEGYVAAGVGLRNQGSGTITISGIPAGAQIVQALLYRTILNPTDPGTAISMNGNPITSTLISSDQADPCWGAGTTWAYRSDVTAQVASIGGNGTYTLSGYPTGSTSGGNPWDNASPTPMADGASLVVIYQAPPSPTHKPLVIFLQGIDTKQDALKKDQIVDFQAVSTTIKNAIGKNADYLEYSYAGSNADGTPKAYNCVSTFSQSILKDISLLNGQIANAVKANHDTDIYLIGHSLGGVIAFGYLALLEAPNVFHASFPQETTLPPGAHLRAVMTLDSPLGGVHDSNYLTVAKFIYTTPKFTRFFGLFGEQNIAFCKGLTDNQFESPTELTQVFTSPSKSTPPQDAGPDPQGADASLLTLPGIKLPSASHVSCAGVTEAGIPSNECLAEDAQTDLGTSFLSIGNEHDFSWKPSTCVATINDLLNKDLPTKIPSFIDTQYLEDQGNSSALYGRSFIAGSGTCDKPTIENELNHLEVLTNKDIQSGIKTFLAPITIASGPVGGTPLDSSGKPLSINPHQPHKP